MPDARGCLLDLEKLVAEQSSSNRNAVLERVADLFLLTESQQKPRDTELFGTVMEQLAFELEVEVRAHLSERLALGRNAPLHLIRRLADDVIAVARPILRWSPQLTDDDLVEIASSRGQEHLHAMSGREGLSARVTDVIVERGGDEVLEQVASNSGARFSSGSLEQISQRAEANDTLLSALERRSDLPPDLLSKVKRTVAFRLKRDLAGLHPELDVGEVDRMVDATAAELGNAAVGGPAGPDAQPHYRDEITETMLLSFARARRVPETVQSFAILSGLDIGVVAHCLLKADLAALAVLCKANGFANATFAALIQLRTADGGLSGKAIADAMRHYDAMQGDAARSTIESVKSRFASQRDRR